MGMTGEVGKTGAVGNVLGGSPLGVAGLQSPEKKTQPMLNELLERIVVNNETLENTLQRIGGAADRTFGTEPCGIGPDDVKEQAEPCMYEKLRRALGYQDNLLTNIARETTRIEDII